MDRVEQIVLHNLTYNPEYIKDVLPFIEAEYFVDRTERLRFEVVRDFYEKYNALPSKEALIIEVNKQKGLSEDDVSAFIEQVAESDKLNRSKQTVNYEWLINTSEEWVKQRKLYNGLAESIAIMNGERKERLVGEIPQIMLDSLDAGFEVKVGHDYVEDALERFKLYSAKEERFPFHLDYFNRITGGGLPRKTLSIIMAGTNVGKTLFLCDFAANGILLAKNILYISMEMAKEYIAQRIDMNLLGITSEDIEGMSAATFQKKFAKVKDKILGRLKIEEYPTGSASIVDFRKLLNDLQIKEQFVPDLIIVDYLGICKAASLRKSATETRIYIQTVSEELRRLGVEKNVPILTAHQTNREGSSTAEIELEHISESFGVAMTADLIVGVATDSKLMEMNQILCKQLKNRLNSKARNRKFVIGVDYDRQRLYDTEPASQVDLHDSGQDSTEEPEPDEKEERIRISREHGSVRYRAAYKKPGFKGLRRKNK